MLKILLIWTQFSEICSSLKFGFLKISSFLVEIMTRSSEGTSTSGMEGLHSLMTFAPKSSHGEIFFISPLELVHEVLTLKMKKKMGVTDFVSEKTAVEKCLNFGKAVIITRCSLLC